jgi:hypothetical protein
MSRSSEAGNAVVAAAQQACALYRVPCWRMNSLPVMVPKRGGGMRPICVGQWIDGNGETRNAGMADLLAQPAIELDFPIVTVPLWIECKAGSGKLTPDQKDFRDFVLGIGAYWLELRDCADALLAWFKENGVGPHRTRTMYLTR